MILILLAAALISPIRQIKAEEPSQAPGQQADTKSKNSSESNRYQLPDMEVVVTATKTTTPADLSPVDTSTVDRNNIESQPDYLRPNYAQLIEDVPGVFVELAPNKNPSWVNLRGTGDFSARTLYLIDGVPVGSSIALLNAINSQDIERIDVVLGPSSALYGSNASGGVINIITRTGTKGMGAAISYKYGSNNTNQSYASAGGVLKSGDQKFHYYFSYSGDYSDGYKTTPVDNALVIYKKSPSSLTTATVNDADYQSNYFSGKVGWISPKGASLLLSYNYANQTISGGQPNLIAVDDGKTGIGNLRFQLPYGNIAKLTFTAGYQYWDRPSKTNYGVSLTGSTLKYDYRKRYSQDSNIKRMPFELQNDINLGANNVLTAGLFFSKERITAETDNWEPHTFKTASDYTQKQRALYLQDQAFFFDQKLSVIFGLRYDLWNYDNIYDSSSTNQHPAGHDDSAINFRGGLKYKINGQFAVKASAGTAYYPGLPTWFFQNVSTGSTWRVPNPNLKPEKTWMTDFGLEGKLKSSETNFNVTGYYGKIRDMISGRYDPHPTLPGVSIISYSNVGVAEIYGLETKVDQKISDYMSAFLSLTLNHSEIIKDPANTGHQLANAPGFTGSLGLEYQNPRLFSGTIALRSAGGQYYDNENTDLPFYHMRPYLVLNLKVWRDWKISEKVVLRPAFSVENLLNRNYTELIYANPGRTIMGSMGMRYLF
jgi:iron complex outermembrane receptor protein